MNIIITGASKGIGYETALAFSKEKENKIVAISRSGYSGPNPNGNIISLKFDLQNGDISGTLLPEIIKHLTSVDILINNAGTLINKPFESLTDADWKTIFEVNFFSTVKLIRTLIPLMGKGTPSHIVNISSMGGFQGTMKFKGLSAYSASKAALLNLTECLAVELKEHNISVNCLCLGSVNTEMFNTAFPGIKAPVTASSMAEFICWFGMNANKFMNGKAMPVSLSTP